MKTDQHVLMAGKSVVAVEIGGDWFKFIQVDRRGGTAEVSRLGLRRLDDLMDTAGAGLVSFLKPLGVHNLPVIVCLPRHLVNVRLFDLPSGDPQEIADMIDLQIARQTPYSRDEIVFDYRLIGSEREGYTRVMLVIAQVGMVRQRYRLLEEAGCRVQLVTVTSDGILAGVDHGNRKGVVAYLDVDSAYADLMVLGGSSPLFSRSIPIGASGLLAERDRWEEKFVQEISRAFEACRGENQGVRIDRLVLSGAMTNLPWLAGRLQAALSLPVETRTAASGQKVLPDGEAGVEQVSFTGVVGAALSPHELGIDLTPDSVRWRKGLAARAQQLTLCAVLMATVLGLISLWIESKAYRKEAYLSELTSLVASSSPTAGEIKSMKRKVMIVAERLDTAMIPADVLAELHGLVGETTTLSSIEINGGRTVTCRGTTEAVSDIVKLVNALEASPLFCNAKSTRTVTGKGQTEFEIVCELERRKS